VLEIGTLRLTRRGLETGFLEALRQSSTLQILDFVKGFEGSPLANFLLDSIRFNSRLQGAFH